jgi:PPOX class probable F420-dependent enzyme
MSVVMREREREAFLAETHVAVMSVAAEERGPVSVPVWYTFESGQELLFCTQATSQKTRLLQAAGRVTICVQTETPPYQYVSVEGPVIAIQPCDYEMELRPIAQRYLGLEAGDSYTDGVKRRGGTLSVRMRPQRWSTRDFSREE